ncbi:hypothetical protein [Uliginosibacterium sediminicola]|uniref:Uncharacterized protein n=1 Tax=Uliginosibacterium sediminicola TaxID=2024550 RepID=A0ABU9YWM1_9RHOO
MLIVSDEPISRPGVDNVVYSPQEDSAKPHLGGRCLRRLKMYDPGFMPQYAGRYMLNFDLDSVILRDLSPVIAKCAAFDGLSMAAGCSQSVSINGSLQGAVVGSMGEVWRRLADDYSGSDQDFLYGIRGGLAVQLLGAADGVRHAQHLMSIGAAAGARAPARIVFFSGAIKADEYPRLKSIVVANAG